MSEDHSANTEEFKAYVQRGAAEPAAPSRTPLIAGALVVAVAVVAVVTYLLIS
ncbi:MAG TPA: hypothetical protein VK453_23190 [Micromonosporaceae bacterium]|nr:hypothetical protein [Micromonosporaceae bacterium]